MEIFNTLPLSEADIIYGYKQSFYEVYAKQEWDFQNEFRFENCICCFYTRYPDENNRLITKYTHVQYLEEITNESVESLQMDIKNPTGFYVVKLEANTPKIIADIIEDIKTSQMFHYKPFDIDTGI